MLTLNANPWVRLCRITQETFTKLPMGAVVQTLAAFIDIVAKRHGGKAPIVYGNCQGGWAITLALRVIP